MPVTPISFGSMPKSVREEYQSDPRVIMAKMLMQDGGSKPVHSPLEGLARVLKSGLVGYQAKQAQNEYKSMGDERNKGLANALQKYGDDPKSLAKELLMNPDTQDFGKDIYAATLKEKDYNLPQGYRMNPQTGQAELVPGVDPSFGKKSDPFSMPVAVFDPRTGQQTFTDRRNVISGGFQPPSAEPPAPAPLKPLPANQVAALNGNFNTINKIDQMLQATDPNLSPEQKTSVEAATGLTPDAAATGWKGVLPAEMLNRIDPQGTALRSAISDLSSQRIHDRFGSAQTISEMNRAKQYLPTETDDNETLRKKLGGLRSLIAEEAGGMVEGFQGLYQVPDSFQNQYNTLFGGAPAGGGMAPVQQSPAGEQPSSGGYQPAPQYPNNRVTGEVYSTPKGPLKWTGTGWKPAGGS